MTNSLLFFGNIFINTRENLIRMKDSFNSIDKAIFDEFIINIRGNYSKEAANFFLDNDISSVYNINSDYGWFNDTFVLTSNSDCDYVYCWLEDQICLDNNKFKILKNNIIDNDLDISRYIYSYNIDLFFNISAFKRTETLFFKSLEKKDYEGVKNGPFIISYGSIIKKELFDRILLDHNTGVWSKFTPFGFEKDYNQYQWLPLKSGFLREEIFASIDDDHATPGNSLHSRGLYTIRGNLRTSSNHLSKYIQAGKKYYLKSKLYLIRKFFQIIYTHFVSKLSFELLMISLKNLNISDFKITHLNILQKILENKKNKILIFSLDNELSYIPTFLKKINLFHYTNKLFDKNHDELIVLKPIKLKKNYTQNSENCFNGFEVILNENNLNFNDCLLIVHNKIAPCISKNNNIIKTYEIGNFQLYNLSD